MGPADHLRSLSPFPYILTNSAGKTIKRAKLRKQSAKDLLLKRQFREKDLVDRSSCPNESCPLTLPSFAQTQAAFIEYMELKRGKKTVEQMMEESRAKLKEMYDLPDETGIFLTSNEADAQFIPILIAK